MIKIFKTTSILLLGLIFLATNSFAVRIETEKIIISNDFVVASNANFNTVTITNNLIISNNVTIYGNINNSGSTTGTFNSVIISNILYMTNAGSTNIPEVVEVLEDAPSDGSTYGRKDGAWAVAGGGTAVQGTYPVFILNLGFGGERWTEFEIKGSTDNFAHVVYYYQSWTNYLGLEGDTNAYTYFSDDCATDARKWILKTNTLGLTEHLANALSVVPTVIFQPSHNCSNDWSKWMNATNKNLVWTWIRGEDGAYETNAVDEKQRFNAIIPSSWNVERTTP